MGANYKLFHTMKLIIMKRLCMKTKTAVGEIDLNTEMMDGGRERRKHHLYIAVCQNRYKQIATTMKNCWLPVRVLDF